MTTFTAGLAGIGWWRSGLSANSPAYHENGLFGRGSANWASDTNGTVGSVTRSLSKGKDSRARSN